jgi:hypothetical protein
MITKTIINHPIEIYHINLGVPSEYKEELIKETYRLKNRNRQNSEVFKYLFSEEKEKVIGSNYKVWEESTVYTPLLENILKFVTSISHANPGNSAWDYKILNSWVGIYGKNQSAKKHHHDPAYKSFCYYISGEEPYTPMVFNDIGLEIDAITDRLIVFPSFVNHSVPPCNEGERIMVAGNIVPIN